MCGPGTQTHQASALKEGYDYGTENQSVGLQLSPALEVFENLSAVGRHCDCETELLKTEDSELGLSLGTDLFERPHLRFPYLSQGHLWGSRTTKPLCRSALLKMTGHPEPQTLNYYHSNLFHQSYGAALPGGREGYGFCFGCESEAQRSTLAPL